MATLNTLSQRLCTVSDLCTAMAQAVALQGVTPEMIQICALAHEDLQAISEEMQAKGEPQN